MLKRAAFFAYGVGSYLMFFAVYAYFCGFVGNYFVPKSIDRPPTDSMAWAIIVDLGLIALFGLQHSIMARPGFKRQWTRIVPEPIERSTYVLISNLVLMVLIWQWRAIDLAIWNVTGGPLWYLLTALFVVGWLLVPAASFMQSHSDLFGVRQVWLYLRGKKDAPLPFRTPMLYGHVRHPLYLGWFTAFWATPTMSLGHLLFAAAMSTYIVAATSFEERDLVDQFGPEYETYQRQVPAFVPRLRRPPQNQSVQSPA